MILKYFCLKSEIPASPPPAQLKTSPPLTPCLWHPLPCALPSSPAMPVFWVFLGHPPRVRVWVFVCVCVCLEGWGYAARGVREEWLGKTGSVWGKVGIERGRRRFGGGGSFWPWWDIFPPRRNFFSTFIQLFVISACYHRLFVCVCVFLCVSYICCAPIVPWSTCFSRETS